MYCILEIFEIVLASRGLAAWHGGIARGPGRLRANVSATQALTLVSKGKESGSFVPEGSVGRRRGARKCC